MFGIIGGTGLYSIEGLEVLETKKVTTPFGDPSAPITIGKLGSQRVAFLPRHGLHHQILPSEINFRANLWALKEVGVRRVISVSAVGSLQKEIEPGTLALVDQYFDMTKGKRVASFFGNGLVAHVSSAEPACPCLSNNIIRSARATNVKLHTNKTYACVEGPRFGTRAESFFLRNSGAHLVGMTNVPEAFVAREASLCYCTVAVATDYDCWLEDPTQHVGCDQVLALYGQALVGAKKMIGALLNSSYEESECRCRHALQGALLSHEEHLSAENRKIWAFLQS